MQTGQLASNDSVQTRPYFPALDGLRGIAILLVLLFHNFGFLGKVFFLGQLGVDLFFVLSGFLITDILLNTQNNRNHLRNFYARRVLRIFPVYYLFLILTFILIPSFPINSDFSYYLENQFYFWTYLQNWLFICNDLPGNGMLLHLWSLAIEEQFYLLWPIILYLVKGHKRAIYFLAFMMLIYSLAKFFMWEYPITADKKIDFYIYSRIDGLCLGCIVALCRKLNSRIVSSYTFLILFIVLLTNIAVLLYSNYSLFSYEYLSIAGYTSASIIFALLLNGSLQTNSKKSNQPLTLKPLRWLGRISYGVYIYHLPIYLLILSVGLPRLKKTMPEFSANLILSFLALVVTLLISWVSYRFFERFFLRLKMHFA